MVHKQLKRKNRAPVRRKGFHKFFEDWKKAGTHVTPYNNEKEFYEDVMEYAEEFQKQFEEGMISKEELFNKFDECAEQVMENDESEPSATVFYDDDDTPNTIGAFHNDTGEDFDVEWHSTDPWRGYFDVKSKKWHKVHEDAILSYSEDAENLKKFDDRLQEELLKRNIRFARVFSRSSNVFSTGYDFFVEKGKEKIVKAIAKKLAKKLRDPEAFELTALTGTDPSKATPEDKLFMEGVKRLKAGESADEVIKGLRKTIKKKKD